MIDKSKLEFMGFSVSIVRLLWLRIQYLLIIILKMVEVNLFLN